MTVTTLRQVLKNPSHSFHRPPVKLEKSEEKPLAAWVRRCAIRGLPITRKDLTEAGKNLMANRTGSSESLGKSWLNSFLRRHDLNLRKPEKLTRASGNITEKDIRAWFDRTQAELEDENIAELLLDPMKVFNADESFFLLHPSHNEVIVGKEMKHAFELAKDEKSGITVMMCVRADGKTMKPFIVYPHERLPAQVRNQFPVQDATMAGTVNGWSTSSSFCEFLEALREELSAEGVVNDGKIVLLVDNHSSHTTLEACQAAERLNIVLITLYPNCTHMLQPLDVSCFRSLKASWREQIRQEKSMQLDKSITKAEFAALFVKASKKLTSETIMNGFRKCGLHPWNPDQIDFSKAIGSKTLPEVSQEDQTIEDNNHLFTEENMDKILTQTLPFNMVSKMMEIIARNSKAGGVYIDVTSPNPVALVMKTAASYVEHVEVETMSTDEPMQVQEPMPIQEPMSFSAPKSTEQREMFILPVPPSPRRKNIKTVKRTGSVLSSQVSLSAKKKVVEDKEKKEFSKKQREISRITKKKQKIEKDTKSMEAAMMKVKNSMLKGGKLPPIHELNLPSISENMHVIEKNEIQHSFVSSLVRHPLQNIQINEMA